MQNSSAERMSNKRKDSGYSAESSEGETKTRDFALSGSSDSMSMDTPWKATAATAKKDAPAATVTIKTGKGSERCWGRLKVTAFAKLGGKVR